MRTAVTPIPIAYHQGITADRAGHLYFDGVEVGGYRTDLRLHEEARSDDLIPPAVTAAEGFNHIGDWTLAGGRLVLPLECYSPGQGPGGSGNTCGRGAFGLADRRTLRWRRRVRLDPADIPKAMWAETSPDGRLLWTSAGSDLLAYAVRDLRRCCTSPRAGAA